jgi:ribose-phosphate pyrophosphokinase
MHGHSTTVKMYGDMMVFSGTANRPLAEEIAACLHVPLGRADIERFPNSNTFVARTRACGRRMCSDPAHVCAVNENLMELLIFIDTLRRDSAGRITAVVPYYGYGRTDKKDQPRVPITARLVADLIDVAGADRCSPWTCTPSKSRGFSPSRAMSCPRWTCSWTTFKSDPLANTVVLSPDIGALRRARNFAERLNLPLAVIEKRRTPDGGRTEIFNLIGDVRGKNVILVDDEIDTAGTLTKAANFARMEGALNVVACATHAIFSEPAPDRIRESVH